MQKIRIKAKLFAVFRCCLLMSHFEKTESSEKVCSGRNCMYEQGKASREM